MRITMRVPDPPTPVFNREVTLQVKYVVVRTNGDAQTFEYLNVASGDGWGAMAGKYIDPFVVLIPLDMLTAYRLGLVTQEELMLPQAAEAFLALIK